MIRFAGLGVAMLDSRNILRTNPHIKFLDVDQVSDPSLTAAWHQDNTSPALPAFLRILEQVTQKQGGGHDGAG